MKVETVILASVLAAHCFGYSSLSVAEAGKTEEPAGDGVKQGKSLVVFQQAGKIPVDKPIPISIKDGNGLKVAFLVKGQSDTGIRLHDNAGNKDLAPTGVKATGGNTNDYNYGHNDFTPVLYDVATMANGGHSEDYKAPDPNPAFSSADYSSLTFSGNPVEVLNLVIYRGEDTTPPDAPADVVAQVDATSVNLSWKAANDNAAVGWYVIARADGKGKFAKIAQTANLTYTDTPPVAGSYRYRVLAADFARNIGPWSKTITVQASQGYSQPDDSLLTFKYSWLGDVPVTFVDRKKMRNDSRNYADHILAVHEAGRDKVRRGTVLFIGDGSTHTDRFGWGGGSSFCNRVMTLFPHCWVNDGGSWDPRDEWTDPFMMKCLPEELKKKPEICVLLMGINSPHGTAEERQKIVDDVLTLAKMCEAAGSVAVVGTTTAYSWIEPIGSSEEALSDALAKMCEENQIPVIRIFDFYRNAQKAGANYKALMGGPNGGKYAPDASYPQNELFYPSFEEGMNSRYKILKEYLDQVLFTLLDRPDPDALRQKAPRNSAVTPQANTKTFLECRQDVALLKDGWLRVDDNCFHVYYSGKNATQPYVAFDKDQYRSAIHYLTYGGCWASFTFTGTGVRWIGNKQNKQGFADVFIDDKRVAGDVDTYAPKTEYQAVLFEKTDLPMGRHIIKICTTNKKNLAATGTSVSVDALDYAPMPNNKPGASDGKRP